jgi:ubiquinone/menaquinone biosynthesis C-methylase UbiE
MPKKEVADFFDSYSDQFNAIYGNKNSFFSGPVNRLFRQSMRLRFENTIRGCQPVAGQTIVDIGCGPGHYSIRLAKMGAQKVFGLDFAQGMIDIANEHASHADVSDRCQFVHGDFLTYPFNCRFDYAVVMGFMDYVEQPAKIIERVLSVTKKKAFFSFPADGGILAWQRRQRYKNRCKLFLYKEHQLKGFFDDIESCTYNIQRISRDFFVTVFVR